MPYSMAFTPISPGLALITPMYAKARFQADGRSREAGTSGASRRDGATERPMKEKTLRKIRLPVDVGV